jgi:hypothetical protein
MKNPGPGYEMFTAFAALFERVSEAIGHFETGSIIIFSHGRFRATGTVEFIRPDISAGEFVLKRGFVVRTSKTNRSFRLISDVTFPAAALTVQATVEAVGFSSLFNVRGPVVTASNDLLPGEIDTIDLPLMDPPFAEPEITCRQVSDTDHGQAGVLDQQGDDRAIDRRVGESDDVYRYRVRQLPDTISILAIRRQLDAIFVPLGLDYDLIETWENRLTGCWDPPDTDIPNALFGTFDPTLFVWDDTRDHATFTGVWLSEETYRASLILVVPDLGSVTEFGMAWDDPTTAQSGFVTALGHRAQSAFDVDISSSLIFPGVWDGDDEGLNNFYLSLVDLINKIKAGGVDVRFELEGA